MYKSLGLNDSQSLLVQGIYGAVGPIANFMSVILPMSTVLMSDFNQLHYDHT